MDGSDGIPCGSLRSRGPDRPKVPESRGSVLTGPRPEESEQSSEESEADSSDETAPLNIARNQADAKDGRVRCSLKVVATNPPRLRVKERGLKDIELEATGLTVGSLVQVMKYGDDDQWTVATEMMRARSTTMRFTISDLEENTAYQLRLRAQMPIEPLSFKFAEFAEPEPEAQAEVVELD
ncbi:unnamed protein product [Effrenium voratum]|nr:unnamed protein product [Effrenium voratum]